jgi:hypothetical protein
MRKWKGGKCGDMSFSQNSFAPTRQIGYHTSICVHWIQYKGAICDNLHTLRAL